MSVIRLHGLDNPLFSLKKLAHGFGLAVAEFEHEAAARFEKPSGLSRQAPDVFQTVRAAIQRASRLVLAHLGLASRLRGGGPQRRCACQIHRGDGRGRTFSVNLQENVFCCFDARCGKQGDVIDLWAALHHLELRAAALDLVQTFGLEPAPARRTEKRNG